jgi:flagellar M-ring protein FliF
VASIKEFWTGLGRGARAGLVLGTLLIVTLAVALGVWAYRPDYQVLFAEVAPRDAAAMTAELDKMKVPYELGENGTAILVPRALVYKTRLALMGKDVPLHGAVGFEVFNNADFGMTEFVQKVNYLRAIQGELTRTILAIDGVQNARVHLALLDQGLFKKAVTKAKASVTVTMRPGQAMSPEQVAGIQRLVAASVADIASGDVTVLDQHGVVLTRAQGDEESGGAATTQLDMKRSTEEYMMKKVAAVLDRTFGPGEAIASVDVALNLDRGKLTTEEVLPSKAGTADSTPMGVVVRERQTLRVGSPAPNNAPAAAGGDVTSNEAEYQVGRRVEQLAIAGGTVRRMTVSVVVKQSLSDAQLDKVKEVVGLAVGFNPARGDAIVVNSMDRLVATGTAPAAAPAAAADIDAASVAAPPVAARSAPDKASVTVVAWVLAGLLVAVAVAALARARARRPAYRQAQAPMLDDAAREQMLVDVRRWIAMRPVDDAVGEVRK